MIKFIVNIIFSEKFSSFKKRYSNPDLGYIEGDEFIRDIIRKKMEELRKI